MSLTTPRLARDIHGQSTSLARVLEQQCSRGRAQLLEAAALLRSSERVVIVGTGASLNAAIPLENLLCSHGIDSCSVEAGGIGRITHPSVNRKSVTRVAPHAPPDRSLRPRGCVSEIKRRSGC